MRRLAVLLIAVIATAQTQVNPDALIIQSFEKSVADYMKLHSSIESKLTALKPGATPEQIQAHSQELGAKIREARHHTKQGAIFTPEVRQEFRRLIGIAHSGKSEARIKASLKHAEPVAPPLVVNGVYPQNVPLQSTPPTLLMNLPALPKELEYRLAGRRLAIVDAPCGLVVDVMEYRRKK